MKHNGTFKRDLQEPVRNRFYYGKLMDVYSYELETGYFLAMQRLLNRLVLGFGVVCGLDVDLSAEGELSVVVTPGMAIDKWGRVIVVPQESYPVSIPVDLIPNTPPQPQPPRQQRRQEPKCPDCPLHLVICYHECHSDPAPVLTSDCESWGACEPGAIRERYRIEFRSGQAPEPDISIGERFPDVISQGQFDYDELVRWVTRNCPEFPDDPCIPLADLCLRYRDDQYVLDEDDIDITKRPLNYFNDMLFSLIRSLQVENLQYRRGK
jgi:hypothetical protein